MLRFIAALLIIPSFSWAQSGDGQDLNEETFKAIAQKAHSSMCFMADKKKHENQEGQPPSAEEIGTIPELEGVKAEQPSKPIEEIIQGFVQKETEFKKARNNFMYRQSVDVQSLIKDANGKTVIGGDHYATRGRGFVEKSEIVFTPDGKRYENPIYGPLNTLNENGQGCFDIGPNDIHDLESILPFMLSAEDIGKFQTKEQNNGTDTYVYEHYKFQYKGTKKVGEADTYVFLAWPARIEKNKRYFEGYVWVEQNSLEIAVSHGKAVPDIRKRGQEDLFPKFTTYLNPIDMQGNKIYGKYSGRYYRFPVYTIAKDVLDFDTRECPISEVVKYSDYQEFGGGIQVEAADAVDTKQTPKPPTTANPPEKKP